MDSYAVAVSGGPDSLALAICLQRWALSQPRSIKIKAFIVDHRLRHHSDQEASITKERLAGLGLEADILVWEHSLLSSRIHLMARKARYQLLLKACQENRIGGLFFAHQSEDQAETILMRLAKGSGVDGLAGISPQHTLEGIHILRPFLTIPKERLIATCMAASVPYISDPSNSSEKYARGRLRKILPLLASEGLTIERLNDLGARALEAKEALQFIADRFLREHTSRDEVGVLHIDVVAFNAMPYAIAERIIIESLAAIQPHDYAPERHSLRGLLEGLRSHDAMPARTLHGSLIRKTPRHIIVMREVSSITDLVEIQCKSEMTWDGRWRIWLDSQKRTGPFYVRPLGNPPHEVVDNLSPLLRRRIPQGSYRATLPSIWSDNSLLFVPSFEPVDNLNGMRIQLLNPWP